MTLGLGDGEVELVPHSAAWATAGRIEGDRLRVALRRWTRRVEHVGSTSVPGLPAKPVIDLCVGVAELRAADEMVEVMASLGYDYPGDVGIPDDRVFGREPGWRTHLVHVVVEGGPAWRAYLGFRDALRSDAVLRDEYAALKHRLALDHVGDRFAYTQRKSEFVARALSGGASPDSAP
ncbi:GrpB family protein [Kineococcus sp. NBC_00420]|uniref:GrpB family protein n=1 Tax=Kineococcus sp. NBC_00420 TaxID=2903564 RepID=UPI002E1A691B